MVFVEIETSNGGGDGGGDDDDALEKTEEAIWKSNVLVIS